MSALKGIRIIDLSRVLSGPYCTMTLGDLGAEVIKIESPEGDDTRQWGPPFVQEESAYFLSVNRNKKSVVLNLKLAEDRDLFLSLVETADVVVENFRPGTLARLGIDYQSLKEHNPGIILASISGFGQTGPYALKPGYDILAQGMGGLMSVTGEPGGQPTKAGFSLADVGTGMWAGFGILAALLERQKSGEGQWIDVSLLDTIVSWQTYLAGNYFASGKDPEPMGTQHPNIVPYQVFLASDGHFILAVANENLWKKFVSLMEIKALEDERFKTNPDRVRNREELIALLDEIFLKKSIREWMAMFESQGLPCGPVNKFSNILNDPHLHEREMVLEKDHPTLGKLKMLGTPVKFSRTPTRIATLPPLLGQHTEEILSALDCKLNEVVK